MLLGLSPCPSILPHLALQCALQLLPSWGGLGLGRCCFHFRNLRRDFDNPSRGRYAGRRSDKSVNSEFIEGLNYVRNNPVVILILLSTLLTVSGPQLY